MTEHEVEIARLKRRLAVAEALLENLTVADLYEHSMWTRTAGEALLRAFWDEKEEPVPLGKLE